MKKLAMLILIAVLLLVVVSCTNENSKEKMVTKDNFKLIISVNKNKVKPGEEVNINAIFKNEGSENIPIQLTDAQTYNGGELENIFIFDIRAKEENHIFSEISIAVEERLLKTIEASAIITKSFNYTFNEKGSFKVAVAVYFYIGDGFTKMFKLKSHSINIIVE